MTQHDYAIANQTFAATRSDINNALAAILSQNSGTTAPTTTVAGMLWYDTTAGILKQRNAADSGWLSLHPVGASGLVAQDGGSIYAADSGTANTLAVTLSPVPTAYVEGMTLRVKPAHNNTGAATLNVNGLGAVTIYKNGAVALDANDLISGRIVEFVYDGSNFQLVSAGAGSSEVTGVIKLFAGVTVPSGFLLCYGQAISRTTYASLFASIGTNFGDGDGSTTFNLPDLRGRFPLGKDNMGGTAANRVTSDSTDGANAVLLGGTGGEETHQLTLLQMPAHHHDVDSNQIGDGGSSRYTFEALGDGATLFQSRDTGGDDPHSTMPPWLALNYIIKT
jgi:microcystin-dependent protein